MAVKNKTQTLNPNILPPGSTFPFRDWLVRLNGTTNEVIDTANGAETTADEAKQIAEEQRQRNDEQDVILVDHNQRIESNTNRIVVIEGDVQTLQSDVATLQNDVSALQSDVSNLQTDVQDLQAKVQAHELQIDDLDDRLTIVEGDVASLDTRVDALEAWRLYMTRQKSEVVYSGISLVIPTTETNFFTLLGTLTPTSGTLLPFFNVATGRLVALNKNRDLKIKFTLEGTFAGAVLSRSLAFTFGTPVPDTIFVNRNTSLASDSMNLNSFFAVEEGDTTTSPGVTCMVQAIGGAFTCSRIKIIATQ